MLTESFVGTVHCIALLVSPNVNAADPVMRFLGAIFLSFPAAAAINLLVQVPQYLFDLVLTVNRKENTLVHTS